MMMMIGFQVLILEPNKELIPSYIQIDSETDDMVQTSLIDYAF